MIKINTDNFPPIHEAYIVGGSVRDLMYGRTPADFDIAVGSDPRRYAQRLAEINAGRIVELGKPGLQVLRVVARGDVYDVSPLNGATIADDLLKRDFTINAMAYDIISNNLVDVCYSRRDLDAGTIRMVSDTAFGQDPLRLLRAFRLAAAFGFEIESETKNVIQRDAALIATSAAERIRDEFLKTLQSDNSHRYMVQMAMTGVLGGIFPEMTCLQQPAAGTPPSQSGYDLIFNCYEHLERILSEHDRYLSGDCADLIAGRKNLMKCALLLAGDIRSSDKTTVPWKPGMLPGEDNAAEERARMICKRLRFSNQETDYIEFMARYRGQPFHLFSDQHRGSSTSRAILQFYRRFKDRTPDLMLLAMAMMSGSLAEGELEDKNFSRFVETTIQDYQWDFRPRALQPPVITGHDLMTELGLTPSPVFKEILDWIEEERLAGNAMDKATALELAQNWLKRDFHGK